MSSGFTLRAIHAHLDGRTKLAFLPDGSELLSCGAEGTITRWPGPGFDDRDTNPIEANSDTSVSVFAIAPDGTKMVLGCEDGKVGLHNSPTGEFEALVTTCHGMGAVTAVALNIKGDIAAASFSSGKVKVLNKDDLDTIKVVTPHHGGIRFLAFDSIGGDLLASCGNDGFLKITNVQSTKEEYLSKLWSPNNDLSDNLYHMVSWSPKSESLAVPSNTDVLLLQRKTVEGSSKVDWGVEHCFRAGHSAAVSMVAFSPNGKYIASVSVDGTIVIWDVALRTNLNRITSSSFPFCDVAWCPNANMIALVDGKGQLHLGFDPVPEHKLPPHRDSFSDAKKQAQAEDEDGEQIDDDDDNREERRPRTRSQYIDDEAAESAGGSEDHDDNPEDMAAFIDNGEYEDNADDDGAPRKPSKHSKDYRVVYRNQPTTQLQQQPAFQPGSTLAAKKRYLAFNMSGYVQLRKDDTSSVLEVDFHDHAAGKPSSFRNVMGLSLGAMSESCAMFASTEDANSRLFFKPLTMWSSEEWSYILPPQETATAVACGKSWTAVATSRNLLRIFSCGGLQTCIISLDGPVVSMVGSGNLLFFVYHHGLPVAETQSLSFQVLNIATSEKVLSGACPISPNSKLSWVSFLETRPVTYDSSGILRAFMPAYGGQWRVLYEHPTIERNDVIWPVGFNSESQLVGIICRIDEPFPVISHDLPIMSTFDLSIPILGTESSAWFDVEKELHLLHTQLDLATAAANGADDAKASMITNTIEKTLLRLIDQACKKHQSVVIIDLASRLTTTLALSIAVKITDNYHMTTISDMLNGLRVEMQRREEEKEAAEEELQFATSIRRYDNEQKRKRETIDDDDEDVGVGGGGGEQSNHDDDEGMDDAEDHSNHEEPPQKTYSLFKNKNSTTTSNEASNPKKKASFEIGKSLPGNNRFSAPPVPFAKKNIGETGVASPNVNDTLKALSNIPKPKNAVGTGKSIFSRIGQSTKH